MCDENVSSFKEKLSSYDWNNVFIQEDQTEFEYKSFRNSLSKRIHKAEKMYYKNLIEEHKGNVKKIWQITKFILNRNKRTPLQTKFKYNEDIISDGDLVVEHFNNFFVNIGPSTASKIPASNISPTSYLRENYENSFRSVYFSRHVSHHNIY